MRNYLFFLENRSNHSSFITAFSKHLATNFEKQDSTILSSDTNLSNTYLLTYLTKYGSPRVDDSRVQLQGSMKLI